MYQKSYIELFINTWISEIGELFDFNTSKQNQIGCFNSSIFPLLIPKHKESEHYYFIHQKQFRGEISEFKLQRRVKKKNEEPPMSRLQFSEVGNLYKLIGGFKIFYKQTKIQKLRLHLKIIDINDIVQQKSMRRSEAIVFAQKINRPLPYIIVRSFPKGYQIKTGQRIRLGKLQFQIDEVFISSTDKTIDYNQGDILNLDQKNYQSSLQGDTEQEGNEKCCRICRIGFEQNNPLIRPCNCKGSVKYIHLDCLKSWLNVKLTKSKAKKEGHFYDTEQLFCEICKKRFPKVIIKNTHRYKLLTFDDQQTPFIGFKAIISQEERNEFQQIRKYLVFQNIQKVDIGRSQNNHMILLQNSVSRSHAQVRLFKEQQKLMIKDKKSKYGTLIYDKGAEIILKNNMRAFQLANSIFGFRIIGNPSDPL